MERLLAMLAGLSSRERRVLAVGLVAAVLIVGFWAVEHAYAYLEAVRGEIATARRDLEVDEHLLKQRARWEREAGRAQAERAAIEEALLPGDSANVAAAELQRTIETAASALGLALERFDSQRTKEAGRYQEVSWQVMFRCDTGQLQRLLHQLESSRRLLRVPELQVQVINIQQPKEIRVTMRVTGYQRPRGGAPARPEGEA